MSMRPGERVSFILSGLNREQPSARRRGGVAEDDVRSAAAVAGACTHEELEAPTYDETRVVAKQYPPPILKARRSVCTTMLILWTIVTTIVALTVVVQTIALRPMDTTYTDDLERRLARDPSIKDKVNFGLWDSHGIITKLQLQVATSMALGVRADDGDIDVVEKENFFFEITVDHATVEEVEFIASPAFIARLNQQMSFFGGFPVLSKPPRLVKV